MSVDDLVAAIASVVAEAHSGALDRVVVAIPSFVMDDGRFGPCPQLPALEGTRLDLLVGMATGARDVRLVPDVTAAAMGEQRLGAGRHSRRFVCAVVGTGVNAAAVIDGEPLDVTWGCLGDAGHVMIDPDGPPCPCGGRGCLEAVCSGSALARLGRVAGLPTARAVIEAAIDHHELAVRMLAHAGEALGRAIAIWAVMLWPDTVAITGGLSAAGDLLVLPALAEMGRLGPPYVVDQIDVVIGEIGPGSTLAGAALLAGDT